MRHKWVCIIFFTFHSSEMYKLTQKLDDLIRAKSHDVIEELLVRVPADKSPRYFTIQNTTAIRRNLI